MGFFTRLFVPRGETCGDAEIDQGGPSGAQPYRQYAIRGRALDRHFAEIGREEEGPVTGIPPRQLPRESPDAGGCDSMPEPLGQGSSTSSSPSGTCHVYAYTEILNDDLIEE